MSRSRECSSGCGRKFKIWPRTRCCYHRISRGALPLDRRIRVPAVCDAQRAQFGQLLTGGLSDSAAQALRAHLAHCSACRTLLNQQTDEPELREWLADFHPDEYREAAGYSPTSLLHQLVVRSVTQQAPESQPEPESQSLAELG